MEQKRYISPIMEIYQLDEADVIRTSDPTGKDDADNRVDDWD